jgi:hypothetical protein
MADPRTVIVYDEIGIQRQTLIADGVTILYDSTKAGGSVSVGLAVSLSANDTVQLAGDGETVIGQLDWVEKDLKCSVAVKGFLIFKGGTTPALVRGAGIIGALSTAAKGFVKGAGAATNGKGTVFNDTATAVVVLF